MMKKVVLIIAFIVVGSSAYADQYVKGYTKSNGTYVEGYHRSTANSTTSDNYSTKGNTNPYTGEKGYKSSDSNSNYGSYDSSSSSFSLSSKSISNDR